MSCCCFECVGEMEAGVLETCGKFSSVLPPGLNLIMWPCSVVVGRLSLQIQQLNITCDTKTKDNVFVQVVVSVQYRVVSDKVPSAHYKFSDPRAQIRSYVFDVIRSALPRMDLDDAFASKNEVAEAVKSQLSTLMSEYGFEIIAALVIDLNPDNQVKAAMNEINASQRLREAAAYKAEAEKILQVKAAEAEADSKYLAGLGVARQRKAIVEGLQDVVQDFSRVQSGTQEVMDLLLLTQYFDMLKEISRKQGPQGTAGASIFLPHGPNAVKVLREDLRNAHKQQMSSKR